MKSAEVPSVISVRMRSRSSWVMPVPSVALDSAPMATPTTPPTIGTVNTAPARMPQSAPKAAPRLTLVCPWSRSGLSAPTGHDSVA